MLLETVLVVSHVGSVEVDITHCCTVNVPLEIPKHLIDKSPINSQLRRRLRIITTPLRLTEIHSSPKFSWESAKLLSNLEDDFRKHELYLIVVHICPL